MMSAADQRIFLRFDQRDFSKPLPARPYRFRVDYMTWSVENAGPEEAGFTAYGSLPALTNLPGLLRVPVTVTDPFGGAMWWGFVNEVEIHLGGLVYTATLEGMANRVAVRWRAEDPTGGAAQAWDYQTANANDTDSQAVYGIKTAVFDLGEGRQADAEAARATYLAALSLPQTKSLPGEGVEQPYGVIKLRGWYGSLDWQPYSQSRGYTGNVERANGGLDYAFGQAAGTAKVAQKFVAGGTASWLAHYVNVKISKTGAPSDNLICELLDSTLATTYATVTTAASAIGKDTADFTLLTFGDVYPVTNGTTYAIGLRRSGSVDASNYYGVRVEENSLLGANNFVYHNGTAWTARSPSASMIMGLYGEEETTDQMVNIVTAAGQFLAGCMIKDRSWVNTRLYRTGKLDALAEMRGLLAVGDLTGKKMDAWLNADRWLIVHRRPEASDPTLLVTATGEVKYRNGRALIGSDLPVGRWARVESLVQMGGDYGAKSVVFLSRAEWRDGKVKVWWE